ncbi:hypothetical protein OIU76_015250 [Salix suchowensis]|nr:hypothetical protein OIU76_015250 [Salix suchowensis]
MLFLWICVIEPPFPNPFNLTICNSWKHFLLL